MSSSGSPGPAYVPYNPKGNKRQSTASIASFTSTPLHPSTSTSSSSAAASRLNGGSNGLVRSGGSGGTDTSLRAPQASHAFPAAWKNGSSGMGIGGGGGVGGSRPNSSGSNGGGRSTTPQPGSTSSTSALPFQHVPTGSSPFPPSTPTRTISPAQANQNTMSGGGSRVERLKAPYHSSFQPQGMRRDRTEEFMGKRKSRSEGKKLEEGRLSRRLEKLVALHFPPPTDEPTLNPVTRTATLSSLAEFGGSLRGKSARDLWKTVAGSRAEADKAAEQAIVKWQEDSEAIRCPICMASFGLKTRRHHCRLCGRVVCFLPPTPPLPPPPLNAPPPPPTPTRKERCSTFITYEYEGTIIGSGGEKKPVGMVVEIQIVEQDLSLNLGAVVLEQQQQVTVIKEKEKEKDERKKVRVCRDCLNIIMRQQAQNSPVRTPTWLKLYEVLVQLEREIEDALPEFQELVLGIQNPSATSHSPPSALAAASLRKRLLTNSASYETISKKIRDLPLTDGGQPGGSQDRLQRAVASKAGLFLQEKLGVLRSLGNAESQQDGAAGGKKKNKKKVGGGVEEVVGDGEPTIKTLASLLGQNEGTVSPETNGKLAVLLEQEALVSGYVEDANARRQFEDAASLKASLDELREEIQRLKMGA